MKTGHRNSQICGTEDTTEAKNDRSSYRYGKYAERFSDNEVMSQKKRSLWINPVPKDQQNCQNKSSYITHDTYMVNFLFQIGGLGAIHLPLDYLPVFKKLLNLITVGPEMVLKDEGI